VKLNQPQAQSVLYILNKKVNHRNTQPFSSELTRYLKQDLTTDTQPYYFLSEDYYPFNLVPQAKGFILTTESTKPSVLAKVAEANDDLQHFFQ